MLEIWGQTACSSDCWVSSAAFSSCALPPTRVQSCPPLPYKAPLHVRADAGLGALTGLASPYSIRGDIGSWCVEALCSPNEAGLKGFPMSFPLVSPVPGRSGQLLRPGKGAGTPLAPSCACAAPNHKIWGRSPCDPLTLLYSSAPHLPCLENGRKQTLTCQDGKGSSRGPCCFRAKRHIQV